VVRGDLQRPIDGHEVAGLLGELAHHGVVRGLAVVQTAAREHPRAAVASTEAGDAHHQDSVTLAGDAVRRDALNTGMLRHPPRIGTHVSRAEAAAQPLAFVS
jgi:hypothetical protein